MLVHHLAELHAPPNQRTRGLTQELYLAQTSLASSAPLQREGTTLMATSLESSESLMDERIRAAPRGRNPSRELGPPTYLQPRENGKRPRLITCWRLIC